MSASNTSGRLYVTVLSLIGYVLIAWVSGSMASRVYRFMKEGVPKTAQVVSLDRTDSSPKGGTTWHYTLEIEGQRRQQDFRVPLPPAGAMVSVLMLPDQSIILGDAASSWFDLLACEAGGRVMAVLMLIMFPFILLFLPPTLLGLWRRPRLPRQLLWVPGRRP